VADTEGAKFWLAVLNDLHRRGVADVLIACVDGLTGFPDAIAAVFPQAWVQTCIVHQIRASLRYVNYKDRRQVAAALKPVYTAANADDAQLELERFDQAWGERYPMIADAWRRDWEHITPFLALPDELRRVVYTTNTIEAMHRHEMVDDANSQRLSERLKSPRHQRDYYVRQWARKAYCPCPPCRGMPGSAARAGRVASRRAVGARAASSVSSWESPEVATSMRSSAVRSARW